MSKILWWIVFAVSVCIGVVGDVAMKQAGINTSPNYKWFVIGMIAYTLTSIGWFLLLRGKALSVFGTLYPVANTLCLVVLGAILFHEAVDRRMLFGVLFGVVSIVLLGR